MSIFRGKVRTIINGSYAVGGNGAAANDFDITDKLTGPKWVGPVVLQLVVARTAGSSTSDISLMISLDGGTTYTSWVAFTQISGASGSEIKEVTIPGGALIKTDINLGSGTTSTYQLFAAGQMDGGNGN